ncbi:MAG: hypothetical protein Q4F13_07840 [Pseudomonadota bacterium]|nr:hypothetical protein [Pseudomonadota bacterium]
MENELLIQLCQTALKEARLPEEWEKLILVGKRGEGFASMSGYAFDRRGDSHATSPRGETIRAMKQLAQAMTDTSPTGKPWVSCLLRIGHDGQFGADFEYDDVGRWAIGPGNMEQRIAEFASMPV